MIVHTHRNPLEVLRSSSQLSRVLYGFYGRAPGLDEIGQGEANKLWDAVERFMQFREQHPELAERFIDIRYQDLVANPLRAVQKIYERLNNSLTADASSKMRDLVAKRSRYNGSHTLPTLSDLGLNDAKQKKRFENYCARFGVAGRANSIA